MHLNETMETPSMHNKTRSRRTKAQGLVEFALILPLLLALIMGIIDFGWLVYNYVSLYNAQREGLRYGTVPSFSTLPQYLDCSGIRTHIRNTAPMSGLKDSDIAIYYDHGYSTGPTSDVCVDGDLTPPVLNNGDRVVVEVHAKVRLLTPFFGAWVKNGLAFDFRAARTIYPGGVDVIPIPGG
jgi:hypothetical protein